MTYQSAEELASIIENLIHKYIQRHFFDQHQQSRVEDVRAIVNDIDKLRVLLIESLKAAH